MESVLTSDSAAQAEELEVLLSIYAEQCRIGTEGKSCEIELSPLEESDVSLLLRVHLPEDYPSCSAPVGELIAPWLTQQLRNRLSEGMAALFAKSPGEPVLFRWTEWIKEQDYLWEAADSGHRQQQDEAQSIHNRELARSLEAEERRRATSDGADARAETSENAMKELEGQLGIVHGPAFVDRKSTFQAHLADVHSVEDVEQVMHVLLANRKIASATHNIMAYRIYQEHKAAFLQDCDDDGEAAAGGRLLHLLQIIDARDVLVVVSRWFGGTLLGPDRFKHINNVARSLLEECGKIKGKGESVKSSKGKKR